MTDRMSDTGVGRPSIRERIQELDQEQKKKRKREQTTEFVPRKLPLLNTDNDIKMSLENERARDAKIAELSSFFKEALRKPREQVQERKDSIDYVLEHATNEINQQERHEYKFESDVLGLILNGVNDMAIQDLIHEKEDLERKVDSGTASPEEELTLLFLVEVVYRKLELGNVEGQLIQAFLTPRSVFGDLSLESLSDLKKQAKNLHRNIERGKNVNEFSPLLLDYIERLIREKESPIEIPNLSEHELEADIGLNPDVPIEIENLPEDEEEKKEEKEKEEKKQEKKKPEAKLVDYEDEDRPRWEDDEDELEHKYDDMDITTLTKEINVLDKNIVDLDKTNKDAKRNTQELRDLLNTRQKIIDRVHVIISDSQDNIVYIHDDPEEKEESEREISRGKAFLKKYGLDSDEPNKKPPGRPPVSPPPAPPAAPAEIPGISGRYSIKGRFDIEKISKRKLSAWQEFVKVQLRNGKSMKQAGELWRNIRR